MLDLRLNPGGLLDQAVERVRCLPRPRRDRLDAWPRSEGCHPLRRAARRLTNGKPLIVLVNGGSASASEIVAGALQDHRRANDGRHTVVRQGFGADNHSARRKRRTASDDGALLHASGKSIQGKGIMPDIKVDQPLPAELQGRADHVANPA